MQELSALNLSRRHLSPVTTPVKAPRRAQPARSPRSSEHGGTRASTASGDRDSVGPECVSGTPLVVHGSLGHGDGASVVLGSRAPRSPDDATAAPSPVTASTVRAFKVISKAVAVQRRRSHRSETEYRVLRALRPHPLIVRCYGGFQTDAAVAFELEVCPRGTLRDLLNLMPAHRLEDPTLWRDITAALLTAIRYLHHNGIVYRDLKPENVFVRGDGSICLGDFDLCAFLDGEGYALRNLPFNPSALPTALSSFGSARSNSGLHARWPSRLSDEPTETGTLTPIGSTQGTPPQPGGSQLQGAEHHKIRVASQPPGGALPQRPSRLRETLSASGSFGRTGSLQPLPVGSFGTAAPPTSPPAGTPTQQPSERAQRRRRGSFVGTPFYMAPEVVAGEARQTAAVDVWSLGVVLYEMIFGVTPFQSTSEEDALRRIAKHDRVPMPAYPPLPRELRELLLAMLSSDPAARPTAEEASAHRYFRDVEFATLHERPPLHRFVSPDAAPPPPSQPSSAPPKALRHVMSVDATPLAASEEFTPIGHASSGRSFERPEPQLPLLDLSTGSAALATRVPFDDYAASLRGDGEVEAINGSASSDAGDVAVLAHTAAFAFFQPFEVTPPQRPSSLPLSERSLLCEAAARAHIRDTADEADTPLSEDALLGALQAIGSASWLDQRQ